MRSWMMTTLVGLLAIGIAGGAGAATLPYTGTLSVRIATLPEVVAPGAGTAQVTDDGSFHLLSFTLAGGSFGPITTSIPITSGGGDLNSVIFTAIGNLTGTFAGISGGPPAGGTMGVSGVTKICLIFAPCQYANVTVPLTPTTGGAGIGIGGTQTITGAVALTMQHASWTIGQPTMTIHTPNSTISVPTLLGGFAHGPASLTSSTARPGGAVQLVTVTKAFTSLTGAFPEMPVIGVLTVYFVPEPSTLLLLVSGVSVLAIYGRRKRGS
jgi:hypothetical protein